MEEGGHILNKGNKEEEDSSSHYTVQEAEHLVNTQSLSSSLSALPKGHLGIDVPVPEDDSDVF